MIHPDKNKTGSAERRYISEQVFNLLKESWEEFKVKY